jgi:hypothetical protein
MEGAEGCTGKRQKCRIEFSLAFFGGTKAKRTPAQPGCRPENGNEEMETNPGDTTGSAGSHNNHSKRNGENRLNLDKPEIFIRKNFPVFLFDTVGNDALPFQKQWLNDGPGTEVIFSIINLYKITCLQHS